MLRIKSWHHQVQEASSVLLRTMPVWACKSRWRANIKSSIGLAHGRRCVPYHKLDTVRYTHFKAVPRTTLLGLIDGSFAVFGVHLPRHYVFSVVRLVCSSPLSTLYLNCVVTYHSGRSQSLEWYQE